MPQSRLYYLYKIICSFSVVSCVINWLSYVLYAINCLKRRLFRHVGNSICILTLLHIVFVASQLFVALPQICRCRTFVHKVYCWCDGVTSSILSVAVWHVIWTRHAHVTMSLCLQWKTDIILQQTELLTLNFIWFYVSLILFNSRTCILLLKPRCCQVKTVSSQFEGSVITG